MSKEKRSFFERLTGSVKVNKEEEELVEEAGELSAKGESWMEEETGEGQLTVDVFQNSSEIIIKTMVAGVRPEDLDISITRDMVTIKGKREGERNISDDDYFHRELYWGSFSRTILLPQEVNVDEAEAIERHGLLILKLPKLDKTRQTKLRVKTN